MAAITDDKKKQVIELYYQKGYAMREVAQHLGVSIDAVTYFMRRHRLMRRNPQESNAAAFSRRPITFNIRHLLTASQQRLKDAAVLLYWAEGCKSDGYTCVDFANSNPDMILLFMRFMREICGIDEGRVRIYLYCYANQDVFAIQKFWSEVTSVPLKQFTTPFVRKDYREDGRKMMHGMVHVRYADKKLLEQIKTWIDETVYDILHAENCVGGRAVKYTGL